MIAPTASYPQTARVPGAARSAARTFEVPTWAFPKAPASAAARPDSVTRRHVPRSTATFTDADALNRFAVADWQPQSHPAMPGVVSRGRKPAVFACAYCHLADGIGRPENAMLAGVPAAYLVEQVADMKSRSRRSALDGYGPGLNMVLVADSATDAEIAEAARYFSRLHARRRSTVVEVARVPRSIPGNGLYFVDPAGGTEPLGSRLIEMALDRQRHELHDPLTPYVAYVPPGSIRRGRLLATSGRTGGTKSCANCHGPTLRGVGVVPPLAGRSPSYLLRQLLAFRTGARSAAASWPMRDEAATLDVDDMIAVAAYAATLKP